jgi:hypothetical protein
MADCLSEFVNPHRAALRIRDLPLRDLRDIQYTLRKAHPGVTASFWRVGENINKLIEKLAKGDQ